MKITPFPAALLGLGLVLSVAWYQQQGLEAGVTALRAAILCVRPPSALSVANPSSSPLAASPAASDAPPAPSSPAERLDQLATHLDEHADTLENLVTRFAQRDEQERQAQARLLAEAQFGQDNLIFLNYAGDASPPLFSTRPQKEYLLNYSTFRPLQ